MPTGKKIEKVTNTKDFENNPIYAMGYLEGRKDAIKKATDYLWGLPWDDEDIEDFKKQMEN